MTHARLCLWLPICLLACARGPSPSSSSTSPTDSSTADANAQASGETVAIVAVPQRVPTTRTWEWRFDPDGRFMAEEFDDPDLDVSGCGIWDIESGSFVRAYVDSDHEDGDGLSPCDTWELGSTLSSDSSADGTLRASVSGGLQIINSNGASQKIQDCASCGDAMAWAPSGYQLATCNGQALEIWDASTGKRLRTETLAIPDVTEVQLGWTEEGIGAIVRHEITGLCHEIEPDESYCDWQLADYDEDGDPLPPEPIEGVALSTFWWPADGGPAIERREVYTASNIDQYQVDVGVRWLVLSKEMGFDRDGSSTAVYAFGVGPRASGLGFTEYYTADEPWIETWDGYWRVDASTQWIEGVTVTHGSEDYYGEIDLGWQAIVAEPNPGAYEGWVAKHEGGGPSGSVEVWAASSGAALTSWEFCADEGCEYGGPPEGDCDTRDVSPLLSVAIVSCGNDLRLIETTGRGATVAKLPYNSMSSWKWGRSNYLALLEPSGHLAVLDGSTGKLLYERDGVHELAEIPLAAEQDRLGLHYDNRLEIIDGPTGKRVLELTGDWQAVALSPDGQQLATLGNQQIEIIDIATGKRIASAPVADQDVWGLAWRQDGKALFYGYDWPTHAIDPNTGKLLYEVDAPVFDVFAPNELDPSWRWIHRPDGSVIRTLDFARIELGPNWARINNGMFDGELKALPRHLRFRISDDPNAPAIYTADELEPWLRSPGLLDAFFTGKPLPSPRIPVEQLRKLDQRKLDQRKRGG